MNKNNTLRGTDMVVLNAVCRLLQEGPFISHITPGVVVRVQRQSPFKATVHWFADSGTGPDILNTFKREDMHQYYIVDYALSTLSYWWRSARLGNRLYLRPLEDNDELRSDLRWLKSRDVMI